MAASAAASPLAGISDAAIDDFARVCAQLLASAYRATVQRQQAPEPAAPPPAAPPRRRARAAA